MSNLSSSVVCERSVRIRRWGAGPLEGAVDGRAPDAEEFGEFGGAVGAEGGQLEQMPGLVGGQLRSLALEMAFRSGDRHSFTCPHPDQVGLDYLDNPDRARSGPGCSVRVDVVAKIAEELFDALLCCV